MDVPDPVIKSVVNLYEELTKARVHVNAPAYPKAPEPDADSEYG